MTITRWHPQLRRRGVALFCFLAMIASVSVAQETAATPTPQVESELAPASPVRSKPIPLPVKIGIVATGLLAAVIVFLLAVRAWRSSSLFSREYCFPTLENAPLRLGASKSGGCLATFEFGDRAKR